MKLLFNLIFFPFIIMWKILSGVWYILKGMIFGILLFPLAALGIDIFPNHK